MMPTFTARGWASGVLALAFLAIALQLLGKHYAGRAMISMARSAEALSSGKRSADSGLETIARAEAQESADLKQLARGYVNRAGLFEGVSLVLAIATAGCWLFARPYLRTGTHIALMALTAVYLLSLVLAV